MLVIFIIPAFFLVCEVSVSKVAFFATLAIAVVYNAAATMLISKSSEKKRRLPGIIIYADIVLISMFSYQFGGLSSDIYILFFFIIAYYGINMGASQAVSASIFVIILYSISSVFSAKNYMEDLSLLKLVIRDFFIILTATSASKVMKEVKKYDQMHKKEFKLARTDKLTGLANRHYFDQKLKDEVEYADLSGKPLNVLIFDLDNFKSFNDNYGHVWGDKLLSLFSDIIRQSIRRTDIPVRFGGEEFLILIRDLDTEAAKGVGDRVRRELENQRIFVGNEANRRKVTVSCGVAQYPKHSKNIKEVIENADKALYHAKEIGKNIVVGFDEIGKVKHTVQVDLDSYMSR